MKLAIKGHLERGKEVIKILEMLGGINKLDLKGTQIDSYYYIDNIDSKIHLGFSIYPYDYTIYTLEEFLEKFPYKVGDKVWLHYENLTIRTTETIISMRWCSKYDCVLYDVCTCCNLKEYAFTPYKEETMEEKENSIVVNIEHKQLKVHSLRFDKTQLVINDEYELKQEGDAYYIVRKEIQYPKTYEECCEVLDYCGDYFLTTYDNNGNPSIISNILNSINILTKLLICRDAYWKIAGEQMGLDGSWEPDYITEDNQLVYIITTQRGYLSKNTSRHWNYILAFPTEEIRDIFYENFKDLIEQCKELL